MDGKLLALADKKIEQMERYSDITSKLIYEDVDGVGELIDNRQEIITSITGISAEMNQYVSEQSIDRRETLTKVLQSEEIFDLNEELSVLQTKIKTIARIREEINRKDKIAMDRMVKLRNEAYDALKNAAKSKQTINYYSPNSGGSLSNGGKFNTSS